MKLFDYLVTQLIKAFAFFLRVLPLTISLWIGRRLGDLAFSVVRVRRKTTLENLQYAFKDAKNSVEIKKIATNCYRNLGMNFVEFAKLPLLKKNNDYFTFEYNNLEKLIEVEKQNLGVIFVIAHFGNWELLPFMYAKRNITQYAVAFPQTNVYFNEWLDKYRLFSGIKLIPQQDFKKCFEALKNRLALGLLADQDAGDTGIFIDFLNRPASTPKGPAIFSLRSGVPIIVVLPVRKETRKHVIIFEGPVYPLNANGKRKDVETMTREWMEILERHIRECPEMWFWPHKRWKTEKP